MPCTPDRGLGKADIVEPKTSAGSIRLKQGLEELRTAAALLAINSKAPSRISDDQLLTSLAHCSYS